MGEKLGDFIRESRKEKKITVKRVSEITGISKSYLDFIEMGTRVPSTEKLKLISMVLQIPLEKLLELQLQEALGRAFPEKKNVISLEVNDSITNDMEVTEIIRNAMKKSETNEQPFLKLDDFLAQAQALFLDGNLTKEDKEAIFRDISELYWKTTDIKKK